MTLVQARMASTLALRCTALALALVSLPAWAGRAAPPAPEFTATTEAQWLNSPPLTLRSLRGQVVLIDFWTFGCVNCQRSVPWLKSLPQTFAGQPLAQVGVHTPEFAFERPRSAVAAKVAEYGITHPVMLDNDYAYWNAMGNRFWPAYFLVDRRGRVRALFAGEVHLGSARAAQIEARIRELLTEAAQ